MAARKSLHVIPSMNGGWSVRRYGALRASRNFDTKSAAVRWGRRLSQMQETDFYVHGSDGAVQRKITHRHRPAMPMLEREEHAPPPG